MPNSLFEQNAIEHFHLGDNYQPSITKVAISFNRGLYILLKAMIGGNIIKKNSQKIREKEFTSQQPFYNSFEEG